MKKEQCANCGGVLVRQQIEYEKGIGRKRVLFTDVPAMVCADCDAIWIDGKIAERMERVFLKGTKPTRWIKIPLWSLSRAA